MAATTMNANQPQINQFFGAGENPADANLAPRDRNKIIQRDEDIPEEERNIADDPRIFNGT